jgi:hypothetical protein
VQSLLTTNFAHHGASGTIGRTVYRAIKVSLDIFHHHLGQTGKRHLQVTPLVFSASWAVDVG